MNFSVRKKVAVLTAALALGACVFASAFEYRISGRQASAMLAEADDFLDAMPDGLQDRQKTAVDHAIEGDLSMLQCIRRERDVKPEFPEGVEVSDFTVADGPASGMKMRLFTPSRRVDSPLPLLVYFHGGGWTFGSINSCSRYCAAVAAGGGAIVLAVDYSLSPENSVPAALLDCMAATDYAVAHASEWGSAPELVSVGGDSAGGNLAIATAMVVNSGQHELSHESAPESKVRSVVAFYPVTTTADGEGGSWEKYGRGYGLDSGIMSSFSKAYMMDDSDAADSRHAEATLYGQIRSLTSPLESSEEELAVLPPLLMVSAERDILFDQGTQFIEKARKVGVKADRVVFPGAVHLFITVPGQPTSFASAVEITSEFLSADR